MSYYEMPHLREVLTSFERVLDLKISETDALLRLAEMTSRVGEAEVHNDALFARLQVLEDKKELIRQRLS